MIDKTSSNQPRARIALAGAIALTALWIGYAFVPALLWAGVVAIAIDPLRRMAHARWPGHPTLVAAAITAIIALVVVVPLATALTQALAEAGNLAGWFAHARTHGIPVPQWVSNLPFGSDKVTVWWQEHLSTPRGAAREISRFNTTMLIEQSKTIGHDVAKRVIVFAFTMTTLFFLIRDRDAIVVQMERAANRAFGEAGGRVGKQIFKSVRGTIDGLVMVGLAQGILMSGIYALAGVPHPILLGMASGLGGVVPFGLVAVMLIALMLLIIKGAIATAIIVGVVGFVINFVADHFVRPGLIGGSTRLPFVWVLIGIVGGVETLGLLGLFVGPAVMAALVLLWREWVEDADAMPSDQRQNLQEAIEGLGHEMVQVMIVSDGKDEHDWPENPIAPLNREDWHRYDVSNPVEAGSHSVTYQSRKARQEHPDHMKVAIRVEFLHVMAKA